jgi:hypothetical protein
LLNAQILRDELGTQSLILEEGERDPAPPEDDFEFAEVVPKQVATEVPIDVVGIVHRRIGEQRDGTDRLRHIDEDDVLAADQFEVPRETLRERGIVQGG